MQNNLNDISISGSGKVPGGEYRNVRISGSGNFTGDIRAESVRVSGSAHMLGVMCDALHASGSAHIDGPLTCGEAHISGSLHMAEGAQIENGAVSGSCHANKSLKCGSLRVSGSLHADKDIEAETIKISGAVKIGGLMNAEEIEIILNGTSRIAEIGGSSIAVSLGNSSARPGFIRLFGKRSVGSLEAGSIEGTSIFLENTSANTVCGKNIVIGNGCKIGRVEYEDTLEVSENAEVKESIKL